VSTASATIPPVDVPVTRLSAATFDTCELFFGRMGLAGLDWGDITAALAGIDKTNTFEDWGDWHRRWVTVGDNYERRALEALAGGQIATGRAASLRAGAALHFGEFMYVDDPATKIATRARVTQVFERTRTCLPETARRLRIDYGAIEMPGYLFTPGPGPGPWPTVILINGLDSAKEVELYAFAREFLARGVAAVVFDGPGQGELGGRAPMVVEFEDVVAAVIDQLATCPDVDTGRLGIFGVSFGGYLAARAAAVHHPRLRCCVNLAGGFDHDHFDDINVMVRKGFQFVFGAGSQAQIADLAVTRLNLRDVPPLRAPLLAIEGEQSAIVPITTVERMAAWAAGDVDIVRYPGERHVATNKFGELIPLFADWTAARLRAAP
jgi:pimeloyl-ACP methyl ester carboxylesterase